MSFMLSLRVEENFRGIHNNRMTTLRSGPQNGTAARSIDRKVHFDAMEEKLLEEWLSALNPIVQEDIQVPTLVVIEVAVTFFGFPLQTLEGTVGQPLSSGQVNSPSQKGHQQNHLVGIFFVVGFFSRVTYLSVG